MYTSVRDQSPATGLAPSAVSAGVWGSISRNVLFLGLTSLFTDISSEMLTAVLPLYFMLELRVTPLQFGLIDGLYQGASALVRVAAGMVADAGRQYKLIATIGYGLSAVCKVGLLIVSTLTPITALLMVDRLGKGIRTAPRDALITLSSDPARLGEAFGVHRTMDTVGAVLGPVVAFGILSLAPGAYDAVFVASLAVALIGVALIALFVENVDALRSEPKRSPLSKALLTDTFANGRFTTVVVAGAVLSLLTASDGLIYLMLQRQGAVEPTFFPLLFVGTSSTYLLLAYPFGKLADRVGRHRLFLAGHAFVALIYVLLMRQQLDTVIVFVCVGLLGAYYAATDGVLSALASTVLDARQVTTGLSVVATAAAVARLFAAAFFGAMWSWRGPTETLVMFAIGLSVAIVVAGAVLGVARPWTAERHA